MLRFQDVLSTCGSQLCIELMQLRFFTLYYIVTEQVGIHISLFEGRTIYIKHLFVWFKNVGWSRCELVVTHISLWFCKFLLLLLNLLLFYRSFTVNLFLLINHMIIPINFLHSFNTFILDSQNATVRHNGFLFLTYSFYLTLVGKPAWLTTCYFH